MTTTSDTLPPAAEAPIAETATFEAPTRRRRMPRIRVLFAAFVVGLVVSLVASGAGLYAYDRLHDGHIVHGVRIGGVDVSDLDRDAAAARLRDGLGALGQGSVVVSDGVVRETLTYAALGRGPAVDALLDQAFAVGRTGTVVDRGVDEVRTATHGAGIAPAVTVDASAVAGVVAQLAARDDRAPGSPERGDPVDRRGAESPDRGASAPCLTGVPRRRRRTGRTAPTYTDRGDLYGRRNAAVDSCVSRPRV